MEHRRINAFAEQELDHSVKLAIARDLQRIWSEVLQEPVPTDLRRLIDRPDRREVKAATLPIIL
jgi:anti-sigma factor NepR-like protein